MLKATKKEYRNYGISQWKLLLASLITAMMAGSFIAIYPIDFAYLAAVTLIVAILATLAFPFAYISIYKESALQPITIYAIVSSGYILGAVYLLIEKQSNPFHYHLDESSFPYFIKALLYVLVGIISFEIAYFSMRRTKNYQEIFMGRYSINIYPVRWEFAIVTLTFIGILGYYLFVKSSGGLLVLMRSIILRNRLRTTDYYRLLFQFAQVANLLWFAFDKKAVKKITFWGFTLLNLLMLASLGNRGAVLLFVIQLLVLDELRSEYSRLPIVRRRIKQLIKLIIFIVLFLAVGIGLLAWRQASISSVRGGIFSVDMILYNAAKFMHVDTFMRFMLGGANLASIEAVATIIEATPNQMNYLWGRSFLWLLLMPIPRVIWPNKPTTLGIFVKRTLFDRYAIGGGVPPSWIGELYLNFHVAGIIVGSVVFGYISAKIYTYYLQRREDPFVQVFYTYYFTVFVFNLVKTEFRTSVIRLLGFIAALLTAYFIARYRSRTQNKIPAITRLTNIKVSR